MVDRINQRDPGAALKVKATADRIAALGGELMMTSPKEAADVRQKRARDQRRDRQGVGLQAAITSSCRPPVAGGLRRMVATRSGVGEDRRRHLLADHDGRNVGVGAGHQRHDRSIGDAQVLARHRTRAVGSVTAPGSSAAPMRHVHEACQWPTTAPRIQSRQASSSLREIVDGRCVGDQSADHPAPQRRRGVHQASRRSRSARH